MKIINLALLSMVCLTGLHSKAAIFERDNENVPSPTISDLTWTEERKAAFNRFAEAVTSKNSTSSYASMIEEVIEDVIEGNCNYGWVNCNDVVGSVTHIFTQTREMQEEVAQFIKDVKLRRQY